jgi:hypothetical protein
MRKYLKIVLVVLSLLIYLASALLAATVASPPVGNVVFSLIGGSVYREVGEAAFEGKEYLRKFAVYKAPDKPFLIVGPCRFRDGDEDFFFVSKTQVIRSATDKGGDMWCRTLRRLHIIDDLSDCEILRAPWWDELKCDKNSSVRYDEATNSFVYSFTPDGDAAPVKLTVPAKFFTPDMDIAPNRTLKE